MANAIAIGWELEYEGYGGCPADRPFWYTVEVIFLGIFIFEAGARLFYHSLKYFKDAWNVFDFSLVIISIIDTLILAPTTCNSDFRVLQVIRIARILKIVRLVKMLKGFQSLWYIVCGLYMALKTLLWTSCLM